MKRFDTRLFLLGIAASFASSAYASGHIPPMTLPPESFASFDACVAQLRKLYAEDMSGANTGPRPFEGGATREKKVDTHGVATNGRDEAHYDVEVGWEIRAPGGDGLGNRWIKTNYSYRRDSWTCSGATLTHVTESGFTLPGIENLPHEPEGPEGPQGSQGM